MHINDMCNLEMNTSMPHTSITYVILLILTRIVNYNYSQLAWMSVIMSIAASTRSKFMVTNMLYNKMVPTRKLSCDFILILAK